MNEVLEEVPQMRFIDFGKRDELSLDLKQAGLPLNTNTGIVTYY